MIILTFLTPDHFFADHIIVILNLIVILDVGVHFSLGSVYQIVFRKHCCGLVVGWRDRQLWHLIASLVWFVSHSAGGLAGMAGSGGWCGVTMSHLIASIICLQS